MPWAARHHGAAIVGMPINVLPHSVIADILRGGESVCAEAGIPVAGGHSIDSVEPIYGLAAMGLVHPGRVKRNADARAGDVLLSKALGVGILSAALKKNRLDEAGYRVMIDTTTRLNRPGAALAAMEGVHAITDVTGFGLLGHALEMARGAGLTAHLRRAALPWLPGVQAYAADGVITGASGRNWASYGASVKLADDVTDVERALLTDPQTSGGLVVCAPEAAQAVLDLFRSQGFDQAAVVGEMGAGAPEVRSAESAGCAGARPDPALFAQMALFLHLQVDLPLHQRRIGVQSDVLRPFLGRGVARSAARPGPTGRPRAGSGWGAGVGRRRPAREHQIGRVETEAPAAVRMPRQQVAAGLKVRGLREAQLIERRHDVLVAADPLAVIDGIGAVGRRGVHIERHRAGQAASSGF